LPLILTRWANHERIWLITRFLAWNGRKQPRLALFSLLTAGRDLGECHRLTCLRSWIGVLLEHLLWLFILSQTWWLKSLLRLPRLATLTVLARIRLRLAHFLGRLLRFATLPLLTSLGHLLHAA
jgi:hypothetical protein